jgi:hypothetical protein
MGLSGENLKASEAFFVKTLLGSFCESIFMPKNADAKTSIVTELKSLEHTSHLTLKEKLQRFQFSYSRLTFDIRTPLHCQPFSQGLRPDYHNTHLSARSSVNSSVD